MELLAAMPRWLKIALVLMLLGAVQLFAANLISPVVGTATNEVKKGLGL